MRTTLRKGQAAVATCFLIKPARSVGEQHLPSMIGLPSGPLMTANGQCFMSCCTAVSSNLRPINLLASKTVLRGFIATWFFAASPMRRSVSVKPTYDGVVRLPWSFAMISTRSFCHTPTQLQNIQKKSAVRPKGRRPCHKHLAIHLISAA